MAAKKIPPESLEAAAPLVGSLVKKDLQQIKDYAAKLNKIIKGPDAARIRVCECCVKVS